MREHEGEEGPLPHIAQKLYQKTAATRLLKDRGGEKEGNLDGCQNLSHKKVWMEDSGGQFVPKLANKGI